MENENEVVNEDAVLDKELEESLATVKAGNTLTDKPVSVPEVKAEESVETKEELPSETPNNEAKPDYEFRIPNKGKFESDESYEKRIELLDLVKKRKLVKTDEQRQNLTEQIQTTKNQLKTLNGSDKITNAFNKNVVPTETVEEEDDSIKQDRERLKQLGGATKEDIQEIIRQERTAIETKSTLEKFVEKHSELKDEDVREVFFDFVDSNYNWNNKTGKELMTVLELARENMFKPSESIQERVLKGANVQEKINSMQFPGGTITKGAVSPELQKSIDEMKATGMSEAKIMELLSD